MVKQMIQNADNLTYDQDIDAFLAEDHILTFRQVSMVVEGDQIMFVKKGSDGVPVVAGCFSDEALIGIALTGQYENASIQFVGVNQAGSVTSQIEPQVCLGPPKEK